MSGTSTSAAARLTRAAPVFAALGDPTRLHLVARLCGEGPLSIVGLADGATISRQAITKHLHVLEEIGLARSSRIGRACVWELRTKRLSEARRYLDQISQQWDAALDRLRAFVEEKEQ
jgi:DNA-binding transcriptional ArsR family regulator